MAWNIQNAVDQLNKLQTEMDSLKQAIAGLGARVDLIDGAWQEIEIKKEETSGTQTSNPTSKK